MWVEELAKRTSVINYDKAWMLTMNLNTLAKITAM